MLRVALLNGTNKNQDSDVSKILESVLSSWGVVSGLNVTGGEVVAGWGFCEVEREGPETFLCLVQITANEAVDVTGTKKIWIAVDQTKINDGSSNAVDGSGVVTIETGASYPTKNYIPLADVTSGTVTDERKMLKIKDGHSGTPYRILVTDENGNEVALTPGTNGQTLVSQGPGSLPVWSSASIDIAGLTETSEVDFDADFVAVSKTSDSGNNYKAKPKLLMPTIFSVVCGEALTKGDRVSFSNDGGIGETITQPQSDANRGTFDYTSDARAGQSFTTNEGGALKSISVWLWRSGGIPDGNISLKVYSATNNASLLGESTNTITGASLTTSSSGQEHQFDFDGIQLESATSYIFMIEKTGTVSTSNPVQVQYDNDQVYAGGSMYYGTATSFVSRSNDDLKFSVVTEAFSTGKVKKASDSTFSNDDLLLCMLEDGALDDNKLAQTHIVQGLSGLTPGALYYLSTTSGEISTTPGANSIKVGRAISATTLVYDVISV